MRAIRSFVVGLFVFTVAAAVPVGENEKLMKEVEAGGTRDDRGRR
jgi:hypothetical protein